MSTKTITCTKKYPEKPITMIVPFSAGGAMDLLARAMEKVAPKYLGQPIVVVNKSGGSGTIGWNELASSNYDGYTLGLTSAELLLQPLFGLTKYNYISALDPIIQISNSSNVMVVLADQPWLNVYELVEYAKKHPEQLKFGHAGIGSVGHIIGESFAKKTDININQVPFRGNSEALSALLGGHIHIAFINAALAKEYFKSGNIRILAVAGEQRISDSDLAKIPTFKEQGFDIVLNNQFGVAAPKDLPSEVKTNLAEGFKAMISDPDFKKDMDALGLEIEYLGPKETQEKWIDDNIKLTKTIQETGILDRIKEQKK